MSLGEVRNWVFDMDGTLTVAVHDFAAIRVALDIPAEHDILTHLARCRPEAAAKHAWLLEHERDLARPHGGHRAVELVRELAGRGCRLGILTRNARELACDAGGHRPGGLLPGGHILGRDEAAPKPSPDGLLKIASAWGVTPSEW
jgi:phosphoglycolate phosphatase-like HAD superfamily hydrolase